MRLRYTLPALFDLEHILAYLSQHSAQGAGRVQSRIKAVTELILRHPHIGVRTEDPAIRRINASPYPYVIFYEVGVEEVIVHAVRHGARDPSSMPG